MNKKNKWLIGIGAALVAATALFFLKKRKGDKEEKPPKKAPQLDLQNPGEQSEFLTSASESDIG